MLQSSEEVRGVHARARQEALAFAYIDAAKAALYEGAKAARRAGRTDMQHRLNTALRNLSDVRHELGIDIGELV